jgi:hypothetical protein
LDELFELVFDDWLPAVAAPAVITAPPANNIAARAALRIAVFDIVALRWPSAIASSAGVPEQRIWVSYRSGREV